MNISIPAHINSQTARLPAAYEGAKTALAECAKIDECMEWADKAAALASYAKQANDDEMLKMATRIRARAIRRAGELLQQINAQGARTDRLTEGDHGKLTQKEAARQAGLSEHQQLQAVRVANVPRETFERQTDAANPPTISQLAQQGIRRPEPRQPVDLKGRDPQAFNRALHFIAEIEDYAKAIGRADIGVILPGLTDEEKRRVRVAITAIDGVHDRIVTRI